MRKFSVERGQSSRRCDEVTNVSLAVTAKSSPLHMAIGKRELDTLVIRAQDLND